MYNYHQENILRWSILCMKSACIIHDNSTVLSYVYPLKSNNKNAAGFRRKYRFWLAAISLYERLLNHNLGDVLIGSHYVPSYYSGMRSSEMNARGWTMWLVKAWLGLTVGIRNYGAAAKNFVPFGLAFSPPDVRIHGDGTSSSSLLIFTSGDTMRGPPNWTLRFHCTASVVYSRRIFTKYLSFSTLRVTSEFFRGVHSAKTRGIYFL